MTSMDWKKLEASLISRAWENPAFRALLLRDPHAALAQAGLELPSGMTLKIVESTAAVRDETSSGVHYLVLPPKASLDESDEFELADEELDSVAGGAQLTETAPTFGGKSRCDC